MKSTKVFVLELADAERAALEATGLAAVGETLAKIAAGQPLAARECEDMREALVMSGQASGWYRAGNQPGSGYEQGTRNDGGLVAQRLEQSLWSLVR